MSRHQISQRVRRISEIRERHARSAVDAATRAVDDSHEKLERIELESQSSEDTLLVGKPALMGAWFGVLAEARDITRHRIEQAALELQAAENALAQRRTAHMESARRKVAHDEMASRIHAEWRGELRKAEQKETDDVANARAGRSLR